MPFCYAEAAANLLTNPALDPFGKIPEFKFCAAPASPRRRRGTRGGGVAASGRRTSHLPVLRRPQPGNLSLSFPAQSTNASRFAKSGHGSCRGHRTGSCSHRPPGGAAPLRALRRRVCSTWHLGLAQSGRRCTRRRRRHRRLSTHGQPLFYHAMAAPRPTTPEMGPRKRNVTFRFFRAPIDRARARPATAARWGTNMASAPTTWRMAAASRSGSPSYFVCIGAITVSGLAQRDDHDLLTRTLAEFLGVPADGIALP